MNKFYAVTLFVLLICGQLRASDGDIFSKYTDRFDSSRSSSLCRIVYGNRDEVSCYCGKPDCSVLFNYNTVRNNRILAQQQWTTELFPPISGDIVFVGTILDLIRSRRSSGLVSRL